jgi:hypothetical protein
MELEWSVDKGDEVVGDSRFIPIIFIWHRWKKKVSESHRLCFSFSLWSGFLLTRTTNTLCDKYGIGEAGASLSLSLSLTHTHTQGKQKSWEDNWVGMNGRDHAWGSGRINFYGKGDADTCGTSKTLTF